MRMNLGLVAAQLFAHISRLTAEAGQKDGIGGSDACYLCIGLRKQRLRNVGGAEVEPQFSELLTKHLDPGDASCCTGFCPYTWDFPLNPKTLNPTNPTNHKGLDLAQQSQSLVTGQSCPLNIEIKLQSRRCTKLGK